MHCARAHRRYTTMHTILRSQNQTSLAKRWLTQLLILFAFTGFTLPANALGEYGRTLEEWSIIDASPAGASFSLTEDPFTNSPVLITDGDGTRNAYQVGNTTAATGWNNTEDYLINWSLKTTEAYNLYVRIETASGLRWIRYNHSTSSTLLNSRGTVIHHGLGSSSRDGQWHSWSRDLRADLSAAEPDNTLLAVHGFVIRGDVALTRLTLSSANTPPTSIITLDGTQQAVGRPFFLDGAASADSDGAVVTTTWRNASGDTVGELAVIEQTEATEGLHHYLLEITDDGGLSAIESVTIEAVEINTPTVYSNAESDSLDGWSVRDRTPAGASVSRVEDGSGGHAIALTGAARSNSYMIGHVDARRGWNNTFQHIASWRSKADAYFVIFFRVDTSSGSLWMRYDNRNTSTLLNSRGTVVHHALGASFTNGTWQTFTRDLQADLDAAKPGDVIHAVNGMIVRGDALFDDLQLMASIAPPIEPPAAPQLLQPTTDTAIESGTEHSFSWSEQALAQHYDVKLTNGFSSEETLIENLASQTVCAAQICTYPLAVNLPAGDNHSWSVRASNESGDSEWTNRILLVSPAITDVPDAPTEFIPAADAVHVEGENLVFSWAHQAMATHYDVSILNAADGVETALEVVADSSCANGRCEISLALDLQAGLVHTWRVRSRNRLGESIWVLQPIAVVPPTPGEPSLLSPDNGAVLTAETTVTFTWASVTDASDYRLNVSTAGDDTPLHTVDLAASTACSNDECSHSLVMSFPPESTYQWSIIASNAGGESAPSSREIELIAPEPPSPATPVPTSPEDNSILLQGATATFAWLSSDEATHYVFTVQQVDSNATLLTENLNALDVCDASGCYTSLDLNFPVDVAYQWTLIAVNGTTPSDTSTRHFSLINPPPLPTAPALLSPDDAAVLEPATAVEFTWTPVEQATEYEFALVDGVGETTLQTASLDAVITCDALVCTHTTTLMDSVGEGYSWQIQAINSAGSSDWAVRSFSTQHPIPPEPQADFSVSALAGVVPFTLEVDASTSTDDIGIVLYHWAFGDEAQVEGEDTVVASHVFTVPGSYDIVLTLTDADGNTGTHTVTVTANDVLATPAEAARLLTQATFGPTLEDITTVQQLGIEAWIDDQLTLMGTPHEDYVRQYSNGAHRAARHQIWWMDAVDGEDQLRQRVAFALSQLFVVSDVGYTLAVAQYGVTHFYDLLRESAFGNYRELLEDVTLSPIMGLYLSMLQNAKGDVLSNTRADENFAREVMQLFSIGLYNLQLDGSRAEGQAFTQDHVEAFARAFTGWNYKDAGHWDRALHTNQDMISPMEPWEDYHDTDSKTLLNGVTLPAGQSARVDLEMALDNIAAHQNVGPFISTHLIRHLVTSNPSPAYVARVATVFNDNGYGVRGDLGATVKAILMDPEARSVVNDSNYGKVREPVLRLTHLWRAFSVSPGNHSDHGEYNTYSPQLEDLNDVTGQAPLRSPSVFNFFSPDYAPSGPAQENGLLAPELEIFTDNNILKTASRINSQIYRHYKQNPASVEKNPSYLDYEIEIALAANPKDLIDHLNLLLLSREVDPGEYRLTDEDRLAFPENLNSILYEHLDAMDSDADGLVDRVQDALAIITSTPDYLVQK